MCVLCIDDQLFKKILAIDKLDIRYYLGLFGRVFWGDFQKV